MRLPATVAGPPGDEPAPAEAAAPAQDAAADSTRGAGTVLVIDDDPAARELLESFFRKDGFDVAVASSGADGVRLARERRPAVITLDVMMPGMDGWAVLSQLKADPELADIPVIMVTIVDDRNLGYALGATDYLTKPVDRDRLAALVRKYRRPDARDRVLVVEDDSATRVDARARRWSARLGGGRGGERPRRARGSGAAASGARAARPDDAGDGRLRLRRRAAPHGRGTARCRSSCSPRRT